jgi:hypothetical protein
MPVDNQPIRRLADGEAPGSGPVKRRGSPDHRFTDWIGDHQLPQRDYTQHGSGPENTTQAFHMFFSFSELSAGLIAIAASECQAVYSRFSPPEIVITNSASTVWAINQALLTPAS